MRVFRPVRTGDGWEYLYPGGRGAPLPARCCRHCCMALAGGQEALVDRAATGYCRGSGTHQRSALAPRRAFRAIPFVAYRKGRSMMSGTGICASHQVCCRCWMAAVSQCQELLADAPPNIVDVVSQLGGRLGRQAHSASNLPPLEPGRGNVTITPPGRRRCGARQEAQTADQKQQQERRARQLAPHPCAHRRPPYGSFRCAEIPARRLASTR